MTESLIGRKVRLDGELWLADTWPCIPTGTVVTVMEHPSPGVVRFQSEKEGTLAVWLEGGGNASLRRDWGGVLLPQGGAPEVRPYAVGFLDGLVGLDMQDSDDEYERGYLRGADVAGRIS